jgi:hypothetical protein
MALTTDRLNDMLTTIIGDLENVYVTEDAYATAVTFLDKQFSVDYDTDKLITNPTNIEMLWGSRTGGVVINGNRPTTTPLNFAVKQSETARSLLFGLGDVITGVMDLTSDVAGSTYGKGLFIEKITLTLAETTEA